MSIEPTALTATITPRARPRIRVIKASQPILPAPPAKRGWRRPAPRDGMPRLVTLGRLLSMLPAAVVAAGARPRGGVELAVTAIAAIHTAIRCVVRGRSTRAAWIDLGLAAAVVGISGGPSSIYAPYALVSVIDAAFTLGARRGAIAGIGVALVAALPSAGSVVRDLARPFEILPWFALFPTVGFAGGLAGRIRRDGERPGARVVAETNRALSSLYRLARTMPGGLDPTNVAAAALEQVREVLGSQAAAVVSGTGDEALLVGSYGVADRAPIARHAAPLALWRSPRVLERWELDRELAGALGDGDTWFVAPLNRRGGSEGVLIAGVVDRQPGDLDLVEAMATELAGALENARLFEQVRQLSIDEERSRVGRDLHDGIAQSITHIRLELELLARAGDGDPAATRAEIERLAKIAAAAVADVRATVAGLRSPAADGGLAAALRAHVATLRGPSMPRMRVECTEHVRIAHDVQDELFRIAQEAIANAMRHGQASEISVRLGASHGWVTMRVADDGVGIDVEALRAGGVGLTAMRERAAAVGGRVTLRRRAEGGTVVEVICPASVEVPA